MITKRSWKHITLSAALHTVIFYISFIIMMTFIALITPVRAEGVGKACAGDYFRHCSHTLPYTKACRTCFKHAGPRLSLRCRDALHTSVAYGREFRQERRRYARN